MTANLNRMQNADGSWSGHHCITGRTFCTASALLVLMADRTPIAARADGDDPSAAHEPARTSSRRVAADPLGRVAGLVRRADRRA